MLAGEYRTGNQKWTIPRNWQHRVHKTDRKKAQWDRLNCCIFYLILNNVHVPGNSETYLCKWNFTALLHVNFGYVVMLLISQLDCYVTQNVVPLTDTLSNSKSSESCITICLTLISVCCQYHILMVMLHKFVVTSH